MLSDRVSDRVNAGDTLSDSACRSLSIECLMHPLSDRETSASAV